MVSCGFSLQAIQCTHEEICNYWLLTLVYEDIVAVSHIAFPKGIARPRVQTQLALSSGHNPTAPFASFCHFLVSYDSL